MGDWARTTLEQPEYISARQSIVVPQVEHSVKGGGNSSARTTVYLFFFWSWNPDNSSIGMFFVDSTASDRCDMCCVNKEKRASTVVLRCSYSTTVVFNGCFFVIEAHG